MTPFTDIDQIKPGMRVICVYGGVSSTHRRYNQTGVIARIRSEDPRIEVRFDMDNFLVSWWEPTSFAPLDQQSIERMKDQETRKQHADKYL